MGRRDDLQKRLIEHAIVLERANAACEAERGEAPVDVTDTPFACEDCKTNAITIRLLREGAAMQALVKERQVLTAALKECRDVLKETCDLYSGGELKAESYRCGGWIGRVRGTIVTVARLKDQLGDNS